MTPSLSPEDLSPYYNNRKRNSLAWTIPQAAMDPSGSTYDQGGFSPDAPQDNAWPNQTPLDPAAFRVDAVSSAGPGGMGASGQPDSPKASGDISAGAGNVLNGAGKKMLPPGMDDHAAPTDIPPDMRQQAPAAAASIGPPPTPQKQPPPGTDPDNDPILPQLKAVTDRMASRQAPELKSNWAQRLAMAVLAAGKLAPYAQQIVHPKFTEQMGQYENAQRSDEAEANALGKAQNTASLETQRQAKAQELKDQGANFAAENQRKQQADEEKEKVRLQSQFTRQLGKPEDLIEGLQPGDPHIQALKDQGWQILDDIRYPEGSGIKVAKPPAAIQVTPEMLQYMPGHKAGEIVPYAEHKAAMADFAKQQQDRIMHPPPAMQPPKTEVKQVQVHGKAHQVLFNAQTGEMIRDLGESGEKPASNVSNFNLSPEAKQMLADQVLAGGTVPSFGSRGAAAVADIYNQAAHTKPDADLASAKTDYGANQGAIKALEKQRSQVMTFEDTAAKNLDLANQISQKVDRTGSPVINRFLLHAKGQYAGDTDTQLLNNAVETAASEYAKVVSGQTSGSTTDSARQHARDMLSAAMSKGTFSQAIELMKQEMGNRRSGYEDQMKELKGGRKGAPQSAAPPVSAPPAGKPLVQHSPSTGAYRYSTDGGKTWQPGQPPSHQ